MTTHENDKGFGNLFKGFGEGPLGRRILGTGTRRTISLIVASAAAATALLIAQGHDNADRNRPSTPSSTSSPTRR